MAQRAFDLVHERRVTVDQGRRWSPRCSELRRARGGGAHDGDNNDACRFHARAHVGTRNTGANQVARKKAVK